jgi:hypothetical protein
MLVFYGKFDISLFNLSLLFSLMLEGFFSSLFLNEKLPNYTFIPYPLLNVSSEYLFCSDCYNLLFLLFFRDAITLFLILSNFLYFCSIISSSKYSVFSAYSLMAMLKLSFITFSSCSVIS